MSEFDFQGEDFAGVSSDLNVYCRSMPVKLVTALLLEKVLKVYSLGIQFIIDVEPALYESAMKILAMVSACTHSIPEIGVVKDATGRKYRVRAYMFSSQPNPMPNTVDIVFSYEKSKDEFLAEYMNVLVSSRIVHVTVSRGIPDYGLSVAYIMRGMVKETVREVVAILSRDKQLSEEERAEWRKKLEYIDRVPYDVLLLSTLQHVKKVATSWQPPPPPNSDYLRKKSRALDELVLPGPLTAELRRFIDIARKKGLSGTLLLVGLQASGRKTIANSLAREMGLPAYYVSITNMLSRWVGESEAKLRAFFNGMRAGAGLAVFDNVELLFRKSTNDNVTDNLRRIFMSELSRDDNNFVMVMTASESARGDILDSPILGEYKLVIPPPTAEERASLARIFLREIWKPVWDEIVKTFMQKYGIGREEAEEAVYNTYASPYVPVTAGLVPGEIYRVMMNDLLPVMERVARGRIVPIVDKVERVKLRDHSFRLAKLRQLNNIAIKLGYVDIAAQIKKVAEEEMKIDVEVRKTLEEYKF